MYSLRRASRTLMNVLFVLYAISTVTAQQASTPTEPAGPFVSKSPVSSAALNDSSSVAINTTVKMPPRLSSDADIVRGSQVIPRQKSTVEVNAASDTMKKGLEAPYRVTQDEVFSSAGTWGDFSRFLQLLPGVVWNSDMSNDVLVRGGNPTENLYVVNGIEVPNINHLAMEGTTGGFTSMIDTSTIGSVDMKAGVYDARYSSRLSSLIEVHTLESHGSKPIGELDLGISGAGGFLQRPIGSKASLLLTAHRSVLNLVTNDIGINGVPFYTAGMAQLDWSPSAKDHVSALSLNGADSINITPQPCDPGVTLNVQTQYGGARSTDGLVWQHIHTPGTVSTVTASYSAQNQNIAQQLQSCMTKSIQLTPAYQEQTHDGISTLGYGIQMGKRNWLYSVGATGRLTAMNYAVAQPQGQQSPYNVSPTWTDSDNFSRDFMTGQTSLYAEASGSFGNRWSVIGGAREEIFALTAAKVFEPRASLAYRINAHQALNGSYGRSSQLAPAINLLSYAGNALLRPMQAEQFSLGADLWRADKASVSVETFHKRYTNEPVSTEYPSLMLANMIDTLGEQFVWLPLKNGGRGVAEGVELLLRAHTARRLRFLGSASYSRTRYAAADGVMRSGNFDFPLVLNGLATIRMPRKIEIAIRDTYATGRPYTPFNITLSKQQSRGIYDLSRINAMRGSAYNRVDADANRNFYMRRGILNIHAGVENAFDRQNFMGFVWMDNCKPSANQTVCGPNTTVMPGLPETRVAQMPRFPSAGVRYRF